MAHWVNKNQWATANAPATGRRVGKIQTGAQGNKVDPTTYTAYGARFPLSTPRLPSGAYQPDVDAPNLVFFSSFVGSPVPFGKARNQAWSNLVTSVRTGPASLGVTFAQWGQAMDMIGSRAAQMYQSYRQLKRGNFRGFLRTLGVGAKRKHKNLIKSLVDQASSLWLEYSYGWKPLVQDMYNAANALSQPVPGGRCVGQGKGTNKNTALSCQYDTVGRCRMGAWIYVSNPNLYLLQQLGVANPAVVAWDLIPFSFVADWVFDIDTFLGAWTDLLGCTVTRAYTSYSTKSTLLCAWDSSHSLTGYGWAVKRHTGLDFPMPNTSFRANIGQSWQRAANAVSLLGQILTK